MFLVCERWVGDEDRLLYWPNSSSFSSWLGCSTVGHWGPKPFIWSWFSLRWHPVSNWPKPSVPRLHHCSTPTRPTAHPHWCISRLTARPKININIMQGGIKCHFLSLWYDLTWDWTQVSQAISEHSNHQLLLISKSDTKMQEDPYVFLVSSTNYRLNFAIFC